MRRVSVEERRARLALRQRLAPSALADTPLEAAEAVVALHATDASTVFLSVAARTRSPDTAALERALYEDRTLIRMLGMRRTMFVVPVELMPVVQAACTRAIHAQERLRTIELIEGAGITKDGAGWLEEVEAETIAALEARGEALAAELGKAVPRLNERVRLAEGKAYEGYLSMSTRVLFLLSAEGKLVRGRPRGTWTSSQHRWAPIDTWLSHAPAEISIEDAQRELVRRWLASFGPGTMGDLRWWTGLSARAIDRAVAQLPTVQVDLSGAPGYVLSNDADPVRLDTPWVAFLPALDPTPMGWSAREWYLGEHKGALFDRSGNIGPSIWCDGRIVGGWAQRADGEVVYRLLADIGSAASDQVAQKAAALTAWLGPIRITPRFRTPLERELSS